MNKIYSTPKLSIHGSVETLTTQVKTLGTDDGVILIIPGLTPDGGAAIGPAIS